MMVFNNLKIQGEGGTDKLVCPCLLPYDERARISFDDLLVRGTQSSMFFEKPSPHPRALLRNFTGINEIRVFAAL